MKIFPSRLPLRTLFLLVATIVLASSFRTPAYATESGTEYRDRPVFNIGLNNPEIGDERQFLRGSGRFEGRQLADYQDACLELEPGCVYDLLICLHNAGDPALAPTTTAENTVLNLYFPATPITGTAKTSDSSIMAQLLADNTTPKSKSVSLRLTASETVEIDPESIYLYRYDFNGNYLNDIVADFSTRPESIGYHANLGDIPGGEEAAGYIFVEFSTLPDHKSAVSPQPEEPSAEGNLDQPLETSGSKETLEKIANLTIILIAVCAFSILIITLGVVIFFIAFIKKRNR